MEIRLEKEEDYRIVEEVARNCFYNLYVQGASEHVVLHYMRGHKDYIKELSFVIEEDDKIIGGIFFTKSKITTKDCVLDTITMGPVFIDPKYQRKGYGRHLITHAIHVAKLHGHRVITTLGYPYHYKPYGFEGGKKFKVMMGDGNYYKGLLVLELQKDVLKDIEGVACFSDCFELDQDVIETYDKTFPFLEKKVLASQEEYAIASIMLDNE